MSSSTLDFPLGNVAYVTESVSPYTAKNTDDLILIDNSSTGNQITVNFEGTPLRAQKHRVKWWKQSSGSNAPPVVVAQGTGNGIESWQSSSGQSAVQTSPAQTAITTIGGEGTWEYVDTIGSTVVKAWALVA